MKFQIFRMLLGDADVIAALRKVPFCVMCPWSARICKYYWDSWAGDEMLAYLAFKALLVILDSEIESLHAWLRRVLTSRSTQTHLMNLVDLSSNWVVDRAKKRAAACADILPTKVPPVTKFGIRRREKVTRRAIKTLSRKKVA